MPEASIIKFHRRPLHPARLNNRLVHTSAAVSDALKADGIAHIPPKVEQDFHRAVREATTGNPARTTPQTSLALPALRRGLFPWLVALTFFMLVMTAVEVAGRAIEFLGAL